MKRFFALAIGLAIFTSSCSKDEENNNNGNNNQNTPSATLEEALPGTWEVTKIEQKNGVSDFGGMQMTFSGVGKDINVSFTFNTDGTFETAGSYTMDLTMSFMGQTIPQSQPVAFDNDGQWSITSDGKIEFSYVGEDPVVYDVVSRTDNKLELMAAVEQDQEFQGQTIRATLDSYLTLEK